MHAQPVADRAAQIHQRNDLVLRDRRSGGHWRLRRRARIDPAGDGLHFLGRQRSLVFGRHQAVVHHFVKQALVGFAFDENLARLAPFQHAGHRAEIKIRLFLLRAMALEALGLQDGQHVPFEHRRLIRTRHGGQNGEQRKHDGHGAGVQHGVRLAD